MKVYKWAAVTLVLFALLSLGRCVVEDRARLPDELSVYPGRWIDEDRLILVQGQQVILRDLSRREDRTVFTPPEGKIDWETPRSNWCFAKNKWRVPVAVYNAQHGYTSKEAYAASVDGDVIVNVEREQSGDYYRDHNAYDCTYFETTERELRKAKNIRSHQPDIEVESAPGLFSESHAKNVFVGNALGTTVIEYSVEEVQHRLEIPSTKISNWTNNRQPKTMLDEMSGTYFALSPSRRDPSDDSSWPMTLWKLDLNLGRTDLMKLPKGPWVGDQKERFQCFSCGCGCYRRATPYIANGKIFLHIYGIGFSSKQQGVWVIDTADLSKGWRQAARGAFVGPVSVSPSGCKIAFAFKEVEVRSVCN